MRNKCVSCFNNVTPRFIEMENSKYVRKILQPLNIKSNIAVIPNYDLSSSKGGKKRLLCQRWRFEDNWIYMQY